MRIGLVFLLAAAPLAGCFGSAPPEEYTVPRDAAPAAELGDLSGGSYELRVKVVEDLDAEESPPGVPSAAVVAIGPAPSGSGEGYRYASPGSSDDNESAVVWELDDPPGSRPHAAARTDANGHATFRLVPRSVVDLLVGGVSRLTTEVAPNVIAGGSGEGGNLTIVLYRREVIVDLDGSFPTALGPQSYADGGDGRYWLPRDVQVHENANVQAGTLARIAGLKAVLRWENQATGQGDLAIGASPGTDALRAWANDRNQAGGLGAHEERMELDRGSVVSAGLRGADALRVGPGTESASAALEGIAYAIRVTLDVEGSRSRIRPEV